VTTQSSAVGRTFRFAGMVLSWFVMISIGATLTVALVVPRLAGATPYVIETGSMRPGMPPGTLVVVKPKPVDDIAPGDVMTYQITSGDPTVVTHRVIEQGVDMTGTPRWRTQGDANDAVDEGWVVPEQVRGVRWYAVPYLGYVTSFVTDRQRSALTALVALGLLGYAGAMFLGAVRERRRGPADRTADRSPDQSEDPAPEPALETVS
jgi:signal peptidase I